MKLKFSARKRLLSEPLASHISRRFRSALDRFAGRIQLVRIRIEDLNGPRGGIDKRCLAVMRLTPGGVVSTQAVSEDAYAAIDGAAQRAKVALSRYLDRTRSRQGRKKNQV
jgi:putative sigma-54 modulation protein